MFCGLKHQLPLHQHSGKQMSNLGELILKVQTFAETNRKSLYMYLFHKMNGFDNLHVVNLTSGRRGLFLSLVLSVINHM